MAKTAEAGKNTLIIDNSAEPEIRAAMGKSIHEVNRDAELQNIKLVLTNKKSWVVPR